MEAKLISIDLKLLHVQFTRLFWYEIHGKDFANMHYKEFGRLFYNSPLVKRINFYHNRFVKSQIMALAEII